MQQRDFHTEGATATGKIDGVREASESGTFPFSDEEAAGGECEEAASR